MPLQKYKRVETLLKEFEKKNSFTLTFDKFFPFLTIDKKMLNNTPHKTIQFFKTFLIWANERNITNNTAFKTFKSKSEENEVIHLTNDELMKLYNLKIDSKKHDRVRDLFLFQYFTRVRYSDIENLQRVDIQGSVWKLRTQKTRDVINIPLTGYTLGILEKYIEWETPLPEISNHKMNKYIKELCEKTELDTLIKEVKYRGIKRIEVTKKKFEVISSHIFISLSLERGMKSDVNEYHI